MPVGLPGGRAPNRATEFVVQQPVFSSSQLPNGCAFVSNASAPQIADYGLAAGFALIIASAVTPQGQANAAEYTFGLHAQAIHQAEALKSSVWGSVRTPPAAVAAVPLRPIWASPEQVDLSISGWVVGGSQALQGPVTPSIITLPQDTTQLAAQIWKSQPAVVVITPNPIATFFSIPPQTEDRETRAIWKSLIAGQTPPIIPSVWAPPQTDPTQIAPQVFRPAQTPPVISGVTVWPAIVVPAQFDTSINPTVLWTTSTFSPGIIPPTPPVVTETFSGGWEYARRARKRLEEELRAEREQWGILPKAAQIVAAVAIRQADALDLDAEQRLEELERELELAGVRYQARYLELLNLQRQRLIDAEIRGFFEAEEALGEENKRRLMLLLAFLS